MTADELRVALDDVGITLHGFARKIGSNERTVRRWVRNEQDIPSWVPVLLSYMAVKRNPAPSPSLAAALEASTAFTYALIDWIETDRPSAAEVAVTIHSMTARAAALASDKPSPESEVE